MRLDYRLTTILSAFKKKFENKHANVSDEILFNEIKKAFENSNDMKENLNLDGADGKIFLRILLKLVLEDYPLLVSGSLKLIFRHFNIIQETLFSLKQIQLLVSKEEVENFNRIKNSLEKLRILVEQSELWIFQKTEDKIKSKFTESGTSETLLSEILIESNSILKNKSKINCFI